MRQRSGSLRVWGIRQEKRRGRHARCLAWMIAALGLLTGPVLGTGAAQAAVSGEYTIVGLATGTYKVGFNLSGGLEGSGGNYVLQWFSGKATSAEATPVSVSVPTATSGINASLQTGGQISGRITAQAGGAPLVNAFACAEKVLEPGEESSGGCSLTNSAGEYTISALAAGQYSVEFSDFEGGYITQYYNGKAHQNEADLVSVTPPNTTSGINAALAAALHPPTGQISGTVTKKQGGSPLQHITVCAFSKETFSEGCAETDAEGQYTISGLSSAKYSVVFFAGSEGGNYITRYYEEASSETEATLVEVKAPETTPKIDAKMLEGGQIGGTVTAKEGGAALPGVQVCAVGKEAENCAVTNSEGHYTVSGLPADEYTVEFSQFEGNFERQFYKEVSSFGEATGVKVKPGEDITGINGSLKSLGSIAGRVTAASGGVPIAGAIVCASGEGERCAATDTNGEYVISGLATNSYNVSFAPPPESNYLRQFYKERSSPEGADLVEVTAPGTTASINAALLTGGQITGVVTSAATGEGIANVRVCAFPAEGFGGCATTKSGVAAPPPQTTPPLQTTPSPPPAKPQPNSSFSMAKAPVFNKKTGELGFFFSVAEAGKFNWALFFKNADVGFADSLGVSLVPPAAETAKKKKCKKGLTKHKGKCVHVSIPFGSGSKSVAAGLVEIKVRPSSKALKALKAGRTLHVSGTFQFQSALGGAPVTHSVSAVVHKPKKKG